jgi:hypothetical protein
MSEPLALLQEDDTMPLARCPLFALISERQMRQYLDQVGRLQGQWKVVWNEDNSPVTFDYMTPGCICERWIRHILDAQSYHLLHVLLRHASLRHCHPQDIFVRLVKERLEKGALDIDEARKRIVFLVEERNLYSDDARSLFNALK